MTELSTETDMNYSAQQASCTDQQVLQALYCMWNTSGLNCVSGASRDNLNTLDTECRLPVGRKEYAYCLRFNGGLYVVLTRTS